MHRGNSKDQAEGTYRQGYQVLQEKKRVDFLELKEKRNFCYQVLQPRYHEMDGRH